ncbi:hypothetical protein C1H76_7187 [Elsinoe australis]|uniref:Uncharacterized protein n=1 Tax=Elsinoe australis TaxID=40998 RepID=A0A4U7AS34_9PEZI|nr:hypothetical protein C1H76_7187 [Elsinoe australis]
MDSNHSRLARQTLSLLEERLKKLQLLIHGTESDDSSARDTSPATTVTVRLQAVDKALNKLEQESTSIKELLRLHKNQRADLDIVDEHRVDQDDESVAAALVLSHTSQFQSTASQLRSVQDAPVPDSSSSTHVIAQVPRMKQALARAERQEQQMSELRAQSAAIISRWHQVGVLGVGELVSEWDDRLRDAERSIRQAQARRKREVEAV